MMNADPVLVKPVKLAKYEIPSSAITYKPADPYVARVVANEHLTEEGGSVDVRNIVLDISDSGIQFLEGQSIGVIPPGLQADGRPHRVRLYSIASSRTGEFGCGRTVTLCVKRLVYRDESGLEKRGLASNFLCDLAVGDRVPLIGPTGRTFLLPVDDSVNLIMVAAGTGIAPFRAFIQRIYRDVKHWKGKVRLFYGVRNPMESTYLNRKNDDLSQYMAHETFVAFRAISQGDEQGRKSYVQHQLADNIRDICEIIDQGHFAFYLCGMKSMEQGVEEVFQTHYGDQWPQMRARFKVEGRWNTETY